MAQSGPEPLLEQTKAVGHPVSEAEGSNSRVGEQLAPADIVIIGAGLAGSLAALILARRSMRVTVIDRHKVYPPEFRCEKLSPAQIELMRNMGVLGCLSDVTQTFNRILVVRGGKSVSVQRQEERGLTYSDMVNKFREAWPANASFIEGNVVQVETDGDRQRIALGDGRVLEARLVVLATGLADKLRTALGFKRHIIRRMHSFCLGFSVAPAAGERFAFESMTYFGEKAGDRIGYATFFPIAQGMRVNLFSYHEKQEPWLNEVQRDPIGKLREVMPNLTRHLGDFHLVTPVEVRPINLYEMQGQHSDGIVLIGDAFRSSCPATGAGVTRLLTDVQQLCLVHIPRWFASAGMDAGKIASFYDDPIKQACDRHSARSAERGRDLALKKGLRWRLERGLLTLADHFPMIRRLARRRHGHAALRNGARQTMT